MHAAPGLWTRCGRAASGLVLQITRELGQTALRVGSTMDAIILAGYTTGIG